MSQENVETYEHSIEAFNRRDLDALLDALDDDVEYDVTEVLFTGPHRGKDQVGQLLRGLWEVLQGMWMRTERIEEVDPETLVAIVHQGGRGRDSGLDIDARRGHVISFREGRICRIKVYAEPATALEAVGLSE